jgi:DeoR/GlpR family transcriptional regulator of sugar metabolism
MLARQRQARIVDEVRRRGGVRVSDLTSLLDVSDMTVRRDLEELDRRGLLHKVHGGAVLATNSAEEPGFEAKSVRECLEKSALAVAAAGLVGPGQALAISAEAFTGTAGPARQTVVLTGGVRTPSDALVGPLADATIRSLHVDVLFLGVHGMDPVAGLTTPNLAEAETNRAFLGHAKKVIVVADHTKWRTVGLCTFGPLSAADVLVTDDGLDVDARAALAETVGELIVAPVAGTDGQAPR